VEINWAWLTRWEGFYFYIFIVFLILFFGGLRRRAKKSLGSTS